MAAFGVSNLRKFKVLTWKTAKIKARHYVETILDLFVPTLLFIVVVVLRYELLDFAPKLEPPSFFPPVNDLGKVCDFAEFAGSRILYSPMTADINQTMDKLKINWNFLANGCGKNLDIEGFPDEDALVRAYVQRQNEDDNSTEQSIGAGIIFDTDFTFDKADFVYKIRMSPEESGLIETKTMVLFPQLDLPGPGPPGDGNASEIFAYEYFVTLQTILDYTYIEIQSGDTLLPKSESDWANIQMWPVSEKMPYPSYYSSTSFLVGFIAFFIVLSFTFIIPPIIKRVVQEKKSGAKELMKMMGLPPWMNWFFHFLDAIGSVLISLIIIVVMIKVPWKGSEDGSVLEYSDPLVLFIFFLLYAASLILLLFTISTLFNNPNLAMTGAIVVHMIGYFVIGGTVTSETYATMSGSLKVFLAILYPNVSLVWGSYVIYHFENLGEGSTWSTLFTKSVPDDPITMGVLWILMLVNIGIFSFLTWYMDKVKPGTFGVAEKWYFLFSPNYWVPNKRSRSQLINEDSELEQRNKDFFETEPEAGDVGVEVDNLKKVFKSLSGSTVKAVDGVSFKAYKGQITALLGHNGAGKSTTMNVLTGMTSPTSGSAKISGFNIANEMGQIRKSLGLCPQHNMLFVDLTVIEHLIFFGMLKGVSMAEARRQAMTYTEKLDLVPKRNVNAEKLSGGMKRKLHLGIALIGDSSVVMLDEPTSGMDPEARRHMWDLLQEIKKERTMILTTHFMEEADVLGDRVVIMAHGTARCNGSPLFLKRVLGDGYTLSMTKGDNCDVKGISKLVKDAIYGTTSKVTRNELIFNLPVNESSKFPELFKAFDKSKEKLDVYNLSIKVTTMEDVFLKVGSYEEVDETDYGTFNNGTTATNGTNVTNVRPVLRTQSTVDETSQGTYEGFKGSLKGLKLYWSQFLGLIVKRLIYTKRRYLLYGILGLVPAFQAIVTLNLSKANSQNLEFPKLALNKDTYSSAIYYFNDKYPTEPIYPELTDYYGKVVGDSGEKMETNNFTWFLVGKGEEDTTNYRSSMVAAMEFLKASEVNDTDSLSIHIPNQLNDTTIGLRAIYNSVPLHARPVSINILNNALANFHGINNTITAITHPFARLGQVKFQDAVSGNPVDIVDPNAYSNSLALTIGFSLFLSCFLLFPLVERITNAKQVQIMTGVNPLLFWFSNILWDFALFLVSMALVLICMYVFSNNDTWTTHGSLGALALVLLVYALAALPFSYLISFMFKTPASGFTMIIVLNILAGCIAPMAAYILLQIGKSPDAASGLHPAGQGVRYAFSIFPSFNLAFSLVAITQLQTQNTVCTNLIDKESLDEVCTDIKTISDQLDVSNPIDLVNSIVQIIGSTDPQAIQNYLFSLAQKFQYFRCCDEAYVTDPQNDVCHNQAVISKYYNLTEFIGNNPFMNVTAVTWDTVKENFECLEIKSFFTYDELYGLNINLLWLFLSALLFVGVLILIETGVLQRLWNSSPKKNLQDSQPLDEDVLGERQRVESLMRDWHQKSDVLLVHNLYKQFGNRGLVAVNNLTFGVKNGECFGLLGVNGAGKTTSFRMLTGDEMMSDGSAILRGIHLRGDRRRYLAQIGYCPQFDSIIDVMTGREMLTLFARLRGMQPSQIKEEVNYWIQEVGISEYADRKCGTYSGGNKRKLNVAQALVADPPIIFLDEPTSGVDPASRRKLWKIIRAVQRKGQSIILTSHSMEECDELCGRLGIMVNGQFQCFGPTRYLKNKFGQGFTLLTKLDTSGKSGQEATQILESFKEYVIAKFDGCLVKDEHKDYVHFHVTNPMTPWDYLFSTMEETKQKFPELSDYSVSETTLEQVFLSFAKKQRKNFKDQ